MGTHEAICLLLQQTTTASEFGIFAGGGACTTCSRPLTQGKSVLRKGRAASCSPRVTMAQSKSGTRMIGELSRCSLATRVVSWAQTISQAATTGTTTSVRWLSIGRLSFGPLRGRLSHQWMQVLSCHRQCTALQQGRTGVRLRAHLPEVDTWGYLGVARMGRTLWQWYDDFTILRRVLAALSAWMLVLCHTVL